MNRPIIEPSNDVTMEDPVQQEPPQPPLAALRCPNPLTISRSKGSIPITCATLPTLGPLPSLQARLRAAAERNTAPTPNTSGGPPREPIDKYTNTDMPIVHDAHPTAPLDHIDIDLVCEWEKYPAGKLLALPFDTEAQDISRLGSLKGRIFTAISEITQSRVASVSAPTRSQAAEKSNQTPNAFLIYNLTESQCDLLLQRGIWSSTAITFRVTKLNPTCPDFLFTIKGFHTLATDHILEMVNSIWQDNETGVFIDTIADLFTEETHIDAKTSIQAFVDSARVMCLDIKSSGDILQPHFNVYASGNLINSDEVWVFLRDYLADRTYGSPMHGQGTTSLAPFNCSLCHGVDHPRGLCPFPATPGWNGPGIRPSIPFTSNRRGRGGRARGFAPRDRR